MEINLNKQKRVVLKFHPFFVLFFLLNQPLFAQYEFTEQLTEAHHQILKLRINKGRSILKQANTANPNNGIILYLENSADVIEILASQDPQLYQQLRQKEDQRLSTIKKLHQESPFYLFTQAEIKLQWAVVKLLFNEELSAAWQLRQAYMMLLENEKIFPDFKPQQKSIGAIKLLLCTVPEKHQWITKLFGMEGNLEDGIRRINIARQSKGALDLETDLTFQLINLYILGKEKEASTELSNIYTTEKDNLLVKILYVIALSKTNQSEKVLQILNQVPNDNTYLQVSYQYLLNGDAWLQKGSYQQAKTNFEKFTRLHKGNNFIKYAYYRLYLSEWLAGNTKKAKSYLHKIETEGNAATELDRYAINFAKAPETVSRQLMQARLYTDGGYYKQALAAINQIKPERLSSLQMAEYNYRKARIYHLTRRLNLSIPFYQKTIEFAKEENSYLAPNAALQIGYIYTEISEPDMAEQYFKKALSYKDYEYKSSIQSKAKAALQSLKR